MAISVDWANLNIFIPQTYLTHLSGATYQLDLNTLRLDLKVEEQTSIGMGYLDTHKHTSETSLSGVTYSRFVEFINGYTVTFEDVGVPYTVKCVGANHNIGDVKTVNQVSLIIGNSAGLITVNTSGGSSSISPTDIETIATTSADRVWQATGPFPSGSLGDRVLNKLLSIFGFLQVKDL